MKKSLKPPVIQDIGWLNKPRYIFAQLFRYLNGDLEYKDIIKELRRLSLRNIKILEKIGLDIIWDGGAHRYGPYEDMITIITGVKNLGWRQLTKDKYTLYGMITEELKIKSKKYTEEAKFVLKSTKKPIKIPIIGPYTFTKLSYNKYYFEKWSKYEKNIHITQYKSTEEGIITFSQNILIPIIKELLTLREVRIQIDEYLGVMNEEEANLMIRGINILSEKFKEHLVLQTGYGNLDTITKHLEKIKIKQIILNLANKDSYKIGMSDDQRKGYRILKDIKDQYNDMEIGIGVIDLSNKKIESVDLISDRIRYSLQYIDTNKLFINPDYPIIHTPLRTEIKKLKNMVEALNKIRNDL